MTYQVSYVSESIFAGVPTTHLAGASAVVTLPVTAVGSFVVVSVPSETLYLYCPASRPSVRYVDVTTAYAALALAWLVARYAFFL